MRRRHISTLLSIHISVAGLRCSNVSALLSSVRLSVRGLAILLRSVCARLDLIWDVGLHDDDLLPGTRSKAAPDKHGKENCQNNEATRFNVVPSAELDDADHIDNPDYSRDDIADSATSATYLPIQIGNRFVAVRVKSVWVLGGALIGSRNTASVAR